MAKPVRLDKQAEDRILRALEEVTDLVNQGQHPNAALTKVAQDQDFPPGHIRLMVHAFNTGRVNFQRRQHDDLWEKVSDFPLADFDQVKERLYPSQVKTAAQTQRQSVVSSAYALPPSWVHGLDMRERSHLSAQLMEKTAQVMLPVAQPESRTVEKAVHVMQDHRRAVLDAFVEQEAARDKLAAHFKAAVLYFRTPGGLPFREVADNLRAAHGDQAQPILNHLEAFDPDLTKQAAQQRDTFTPMDARRSPYKELTGCLAALTDYARHKEHWETLRDHPLATKLAGFLKGAADDKKKTPSGGKSLLSQFLGATKSVGSSGLKATGSFLGGVGTGAKHTFDAAATHGPIALEKWLGQDPKKQLQDHYQGLTSPVHQRNLETIQTRAMLNDMLSNDEVISGYEPHEVLSAYNELRTLAPRALSSPAAVRAVLRRRLAQGQSDPHELHQLTEMEEALKKRNVPEGALLPPRPGKIEA